MHVPSNHKVLCLHGTSNQVHGGYIRLVGLLVEACYHRLNKIRTKPEGERISFSLVPRLIFPGFYLLQYEKWLLQAIKAGETSLGMRLNKLHKRGGRGRGTLAKLPSAIKSG